MAKLAVEARHICPELIEVIKTLDNLAYTRRYDEVFEDFINWLIWQHLYPPDEKNEEPLSKYSDEEKAKFVEMLQIIMSEVKTRIGLWTHTSQDSINLYPTSWYDPLGRIYEAIVSRYKSKRLGQYFTPESVVDVITQLVNPGGKKEMTTILDPACGSGRMGLAGAAHAMAKGIPTWVTMNDLDPICTKMTAINMCLNGIVGEALCMNGLDIEGTSYRFGYKIVPALSIYPQDMWEYYRMLILMKTQQDIRKQYLILPITYEQTYLKGTNEQLLKEYEERLQIQEKEEREKAIQELHNKIQARMAGTLFEGDQTQIENITNQVQKEVHKQKVVKKKPNQSEDDQLSLF